MSLLRSLGVCLIGTYFCALGAADNPAKRECNLRFAWWTAPEKEYNLFLQNDKEDVALSLAPMAFGQPIVYKGKDDVVIAQKEISSEPDKAGKSKEAWFNYCSFKIKPEDTDIAAFLLPDEAKDTAKAKTLDLRVDKFPYGSILLVNYTQARLACNLGGGVFFSEPGEATPSPKVYTEQSTASFALAVLEANGAQHSLTSTRILMSGKMRVVHIVIETAETNPKERFQTKTIVDLNNRPRPTATGNSGTAQGKKPGDPKTVPKK
jgi:hypothetical protein